MIVILYNSPQLPSQTIDQLSEYLKHAQPSCSCLLYSAYYFTRFLITLWRVTLSFIVSGHIYYYLKSKVGKEVCQVQFNCFFFFQRSQAWQKNWRKVYFLFMTIITSLFRISCKSFLRSWRRSDRLKTNSSRFVILWRWCIKTCVVNLNCNLMGGKIKDGERIQ